MALTAPGSGGGSTTLGARTYTYSIEVLSRIAHSTTLFQYSKTVRSIFRKQTLFLKLLRASPEVASASHLWTALPFLCLTVCKIIRAKTTPLLSLFYFLYYVPYTISLFWFYHTLDLLLPKIKHTSWEHDISQMSTKRVNLASPGESSQPDPSSTPPDICLVESNSTNRFNSTL